MMMMMMMKSDGDVHYRLSFGTRTGLAVASFPLLENWTCKKIYVIGKQM
jgi:hypothetical protein